MQALVSSTYLGIDAIVDEPARLLPGHVVGASKPGEAPVPAHHDLLAASKLELGSPQRLLGLQPYSTDMLSVTNIICPTGLCYCSHHQVSFDHVVGTHSCVVDVLAADGQQDLPNVHARTHALGLAEGAAHAGLQVT